MSQTEAYRSLVRRVAERRRALVRDEQGREIFPPQHEPWVPSNRENAACESFIVLFVAELESYLEEIVRRALNSYLNGFQSSFFSDCGAGSRFYETVKSKSDEWKKNNNANWKRISGFFEFIGLSSGKFPPGMWDVIEDIVSQRGSIVHSSVGLRAVNDPRLTIAKISKVLALLKLFDRDAANWLSRIDLEVQRLSSSSTRFLPGMGTIATR